MPSRGAIIGIVVVCVIVIVVSTVLGVYYSNSSCPSFGADCSSTPPAAPAATPGPVSAPTPTSPAGTPSPVAAALLATPSPAPAAPTWTTYPNTECYNSNYDIGYNGVQSVATIQQACTADSRCAGAVQHGGGDWWLLSGVHANNGVGGSPGNQCIVAPGKSLV